MSAPTLDDWIEQVGFKRLRDQIECHCDQFLRPGEAIRLTRLIMISLRDEVEAAPESTCDVDPRLDDEAMGCRLIKD